MQTSAYDSKTNGHDWRTRIMTKASEPKLYIVQANVLPERATLFSADLMLGMFLAPPYNKVTKSRWDFPAKARR